MPPPGAAPWSGPVEVGAAGAAPCGGSSPCGGHWGGAAACDAVIARVAQVVPKVVHTDVVFVSSHGLAYYARDAPIPQWTVEPHGSGSAVGQAVSTQAVAAVDPSGTGIGRGLLCVPVVHGGAVVCALQVIGDETAFAEAEVCAISSFASSIAHLLANVYSQ
eukprot:TRINITY_DN5750_c0_g4_i4.p1 TRINITY_DN5750_c0_g4~~TRINITY_DN5750_c0_g4_i4.p1  ORF type:complete len:170 (+),score=30.41 TRINITY_DN5750_c0_g4_i4:25-510(+)